MPRFCTNLTMMFTEVPFLDRFNAASAAGFAAAEMLSPYDAAASEVRSAADAAGVAFALYNTPLGDTPGARGHGAIPGGRDLFRAGFEKAIAYAEDLQPDCIHVMAGLAEGGAAEETFLENLAWAAAQAPDQRLAIEPINNRDIPGYFLNTTDQAVRILDAVNAPNLGLQFDVYHVQIMEGDLTRRLERLAPRIFHVQIAGVPDRHEPDRGEFALNHVLSTLDRIGYQGWVGCEYNPAGRTEDGLGWMAAFR